MCTYTFTQAQLGRLKELGLDDLTLARSYSSAQERQKDFHRLEKEYMQANRKKLWELTNHTRQVSLCRLSDDLSCALREHGFTEVSTPTIISKKALEKMTITEEDPLYAQVFWLGSGKALRPMLAPNLYDVSRSLIEIQGLPLRIFEIGSCFRKESEGNAHLNEFTMLNLVEWGTPLEERTGHLKEFAGIVLEAAGIQGYRFVEEESTVYGKGLDVVSDKGVELASTSMGPHPLDDAWKVTCSWTGIGFGLERLLMVREQERGIHRYSRSCRFMDGACLKIR